MIQDVIQHLNLEGYQIRNITPDGKIHRFKTDTKDKKNSGYYICFQNQSQTAKEFYVCVYGSWKDTQAHTFCSLAANEMQKDDRALIKKKIEEAKKKAEAEKIKRHEEASIAAQKLLLGLQKSGNSLYLKEKQIDDIKSSLNILYGDNGLFYVPMKDIYGKIWSYQMITNEGKKFFKKGGRIDGLFHVIGHQPLTESTEEIYIAEGLSTAASVYKAVRKPVVVAYNAQNLIKVAREVRQLCKTAEITICGDDDHESTNAKGELYNSGRISAEKAALEFMCQVVFPVFASPEGKTDFNDLLIFEGLETLEKQILKAEKRDLIGVFPLGFLGSNYFFTSTQNQQISSIASFTEMDFLKLAPLEYWEALYPGSRSARVDWVQAKSVLAAKCQMKGIFDPKRVRGTGVWLDKGRIIVNSGDHLLVDGKKMRMVDVKSDHFYILGTALRIPQNLEPLTVEECQPIVQAAHLFKWKSPDFPYLLAGAMVTMRVCGALPIRPHVWLTGESGSGKSTLFNHYITPLLGKQALSIFGNSTEAGIRQAVQSNAFPVIFDEFENSGLQSQERLNSVVDLLRSSWSESSAVLLKGSASGVAQEYSLNFSAIVVSIRQGSLNDADASRFATIELGPHNNDQEHWEQLKACLDKIDFEMGDRLFKRVIEKLPVLISNFKLIKKAFGKNAVRQRFADQYGMLLAGYSILGYDVAITDDEAEFLVDQVKLQEEKDSHVEDHVECLEHLLTSTLSYKTDGLNEGLVGTLINAAQAGDKVLTRVLLENGIHIGADYFSIHNPKHTTLESKIFRSTKWSNSWHKALKRISVSKESARDFGSGTKRVVSLPYSLIKDQK